MRFGAHARAQQARFHETLPPAARAPTDDKGRRHGHLLAIGYEQQNLIPELRGAGGAVDFFRPRGIKWWRNPLSGDPKGDGPTRNLASSQLACVNFLLPLARRPSALLALMQQIDPDVVAVEPIPDPLGADPELVEFEWVGWSAPIEGGRVNRGAMQTSADAVVLGRTVLGLRAFVFEWKYCEEYLHPSDQGTGSSGDTRRRRYQGRYSAPDSTFRGDIPLDDFFFDPFYQLMRLRLLADEIARSCLGPELPVVDARVVVVCPKANRDYLVPVSTTPLARRYPDLLTIEAIMQATLRDPAGIRVASSEDLIAGLRGSAVAGALVDWLDYHALRYGW